MQQISFPNRLWYHLKTFGNLPPFKRDLFLLIDWLWCNWVINSHSIDNLWSSSLRIKAFFNDDFLRTTLNRLSQFLDTEFQTKSLSWHECYGVLTFLTRKTENKHITKQRSMLWFVSFSECSYGAEESGIGREEVNMTTGSRTAANIWGI